jgi:hypothetical protein
MIALFPNPEFADDENSQVFNHIYQYFGALIGPAFPSYQGRTSMYEVHKYAL